MNLDRLKLMEQYAREVPDDPFPTYALALEWVKDDPAKAMELFDLLLNKFPDYLPVYYHAGLLCINEGDPIKARRVLELGMEKLKVTGDNKALAELVSLHEIVSS